MGRIRTAAEILDSALKAAVDTDQGGKAAEEVGNTAVTLSKAVNNVLLPIAAVNYAFDRAREYFAERFESDLADATAHVPPEDLLEPKASIAGPALQGLAFSHTENDLKQLYLNLLATSMDGRIAGAAHPAFAEVVRQITPVEARFLSRLLGTDKAYAIGAVQGHFSDGSGYATLLEHLVPMRLRGSKQRVELPGFAVFVENWTRLGLVVVDYATSLTDAGAYDWMRDAPEVRRVREVLHTDDLRRELGGAQVKLRFVEGVIRRTAFGGRFARAVGIDRER